MDEPLQPATGPDLESAAIIKVAATSRSSAVAGAIAGIMRTHKFAEVQAIGAGAVNQAVKALAIAKGYLERDGIDIVCRAQFIGLKVEKLSPAATLFS